MSPFSKAGVGPLDERRKLVGILCLSLLQLGFEFLIMKLARYQFGTLSIGVIALGLLGVAAAALSVSLFRSPERAIATAIVALPVLAWVCIAVQTDQGFGPPDLSVGNFVVAGLLAFVVLALCSVPVFAYIHANVASIHRYYAASFIGGALGIPLTLVLLEVGGDLRTGSALLALTMVPPLMLVGNARVRALAIAVAGIAAATSVPAFEYLDRRAHRSSIYRESDALARIDVLKAQFSGALTADPTYDPNLAIQFAQAGRGGRTRASPVAIDGPDRVLRDDVGFLPWSLSPGKALVLGSGAGLELLAALRAGATEVHAVEIDGKVLDYMNRVSPASHNPYASPRVKAYVGEGRDIAARIGRVEGATFDLVYIPTAVLRGQSGQVFSQNHLVTEEAFYQYLGMLNETGVVGVSFPIAGALRARTAAAMSRALRRRGIGDPEAHLLVFQGEASPKWVVLGKVGGPFSAAESQALLGGSDRIRLVEARSEVQAGQGMRPFDDNNPFMFPEGVIEAIETRDDLAPAQDHRRSRPPPAPSDVFDWHRASLTPILASAVVLILCIVGLGLATADAGARIPRSGFLACFTAIGFAYVIYQTLMLQRLAFLVGHPMLATAFILTTALLASGAGSWLSGNALAAHRTGVRAIGSGATVLWIIGLSMVRAEWMILPAVPAVLRTIAGIALCGPPFIMMGTYFAVALKRAEHEAPGCVTWGWGLNGIAAIAGWSFMIGGSMSQGIEFVGLFAALVYALVGAWEFLTGRATVAARTRTFAHAGFATVVLIGLAASLWLIS